MPTSIHPYLPVGLALFFGFFIAIAASVASSLLGPHKFTRAKYEVIECGVPVVGSARQPLSVKFYLTAILFILFDIETVFLYLWASAFDYFGWFGLIEVALFMVTLVIGYVYVLKRGALRWE